MCAGIVGYVVCQKTLALRFYKFFLFLTEKQLKKSRYAVKISNFRIFTTHRYKEVG